MFGTCASQFECWREENDLPDQAGDCTPAKAISPPAKPFRVFSGHGFPYNRLFTLIYAAISGGCFGRQI
jgi:hypothetical protein